MKEDCGNFCIVEIPSRSLDGCINIYPHICLTQKWKFYIMIGIFFFITYLRVVVSFAIAEFKCIHFDL